MFHTPQLAGNSQLFSRRSSSKARTLVLGATRPTDCWEHRVGPGNDLDPRHGDRQLRWICWRGFGDSDESGIQDRTYGDGRR